MSEQGVVFFLSDHGFGHASRSGTVVSRVLDIREAATPVCIVTAVPTFFLDETILGVAASTVTPRPDLLEWDFVSRTGEQKKALAQVRSAGTRSFTLIPVETDIGVLQKTSVDLDIPATAAALGPFWDSFVPQCVIKLADALISWGSFARIVADVPAIAPLVKEELRKRNISVECLLISNFTWDWIYQPFPDMLGAFVERICDAYSKADGMIALPLSSDHLKSSSFSNGSRVAVRHLPGLLGRRSDRDPSSVRSWLLSLSPSPFGPSQERLPCLSACDRD